MEIRRKIGIKVGFICFSILAIPWIFTFIYSLLTDLEGLRLDNVIGTLIGIFAFSIAASFLGYSIAKESKLLILLALGVVIAVPLVWALLGWTP